MRNDKTSFYPALRVALAKLDCREVAQIHLPATSGQVDPTQPFGVPKRPLAALRSWDADFAICRGRSLEIVAVLGLRSASDNSTDPERFNLEQALNRALADESIPVVLVSESACYDPEHIVRLIRPHLSQDDRATATT